LLALGLLFFRASPMCMIIEAPRVERGTSLRFDMASYIRGSPSRAASARASLARSLITQKYGDDRDRERND
jgi:hypothetical protein